MEDIPVTLQQEIYQSLINKGVWVDEDNLIRVTAYISESAGKFDDATGTWIPEIEGADIDVLKPSADLDIKGRKGISKLRRKFNEVRFALPEGHYSLHADDPAKAKLYERWFKKDPLVIVGDQAGKKHRKTGEFIRYNTLDLHVPETLVQIGNYQDTARVVYLRPNTTEGRLHARQLEEAYQALGKEGRGLKPYYLQEDGQLSYFKKGKYKSTDANPQGLGFDKIAGHRGRSFRYAQRKTGATPKFEEIYDTLKGNFPGVSDDELKSFTEIYEAMNNGEIDKLTAQRAMSNVKLHGDHSISLKQGGLNWYNNLANRPAQVNLQKSSKSTSPTYNDAFGISSDRSSTILGGLRSDINANAMRKIGRGTSGADAALRIASGDYLGGGIGLAMQTPAFQKAIAKTLAKSGAKIAPGVGIGLSTLEAAGYSSQGRWTQAGIAALSGVVGEVPLIGDAVSAGLDLTNTAIDIATGNIKPDIDEEEALRKVGRTSRQLSLF